MAVDLTSFRINTLEKPASSAKQNAMLDFLEGAFNAFPASQIVGFPSPPDATKFLNGAGAFTTIPPPAGAATVYAKTTPTDVVNTVSKTDLLNLTIGAGVVGANGCVKVAAGGDYLNNTGSDQTITLELRLGATVIWGSVASEPLSNATTRHAWHLSAIIQALNSTSSQAGGGDLYLSSSTAPTYGSGVPADPGGATKRMLIGTFISLPSAVDMTAAQALAFSVTHSAANANLSMRCLYARAEALG